jgi:hypothetical protein
VSATLTYVYCLVRSAGRPSLRGVPAGMPGSGPVRLLEVVPPDGDTPSRRRPAPSHRRTVARSHRDWLIVTSVPQREYGEAALERGLKHLEWVGRRAVAHEAVVEHFLAAPAVLPMQLFTLFTSDDRAVQHVLRDRRALARILARIERKVEWGVRLTWDERAARETVERKHAGPEKRQGGEASGASYLARKRDLLDVSRGQLKDARADADRFFRALKREASESQRRTATEQAAPGSRLLLDAAFLVPIARAGSFRLAVRRNAKKLDGTGLAVSLTGPWPPYNFI